MGVIRPALGEGLDLPIEGKLPIQLSYNKTSKPNILKDKKLSYQGWLDWRE